jgi:hypothetical protein
MSKAPGGHQGLRARLGANLPYPGDLLSAHTSGAEDPEPISGSPAAPTAPVSSRPPARDPISAGACR